MKFEKLFCLTLTVVIVLCASARSQASPFVNLNFEQSTVLKTDPQVVSTSAAFPGWTAQFNGVTSSNVYHDYEGAGEPIVALYDTKVSGAAQPLLQGKYMAYLAPGTPNEPTSLSQVGDIPSNATTLTLLADGGAGPPIVKIDGTVIPMAFLSGIPFGGDTAKFGGDISAFAGETVEVRFESTSFFDHPSGRHSFDDIQFVPEPSIAIPLILWILFANRYAIVRRKIT